MPRRSVLLEIYPDDVSRSGVPLTPRTIPDSTIAALRELFVHMVRDESKPDADGTVRISDDVREALRHLCEDARRHEVRAEQLVIAIKQGWLALHQDHPRSRAAGPDELLNLVITVCIDEYYTAKERR